MKMFLSCTFIVALTRQAGAMILTTTSAPQLRGAAANSSSEVRLAQANSSSEVRLAQAKKPKDQRVMDAISQFRAEICADMKDEHGTKFESFEACEKFMDDTCKPGKDHAMDGDRKEVTSQQGFCSEFFPKAKKKAEEKIDKDDKEEASKVSATLPAPAPAPAPAPQATAGSPAPGPMAAPAGPGPAPAPAPFLPGLTAGKPWGTIPDDEKYYYKKGGKDKSRIHMSEQMKLPEQGYWGKLVEHEDKKTAISDWGHEFGPLSAHESFESICRQHPDNQWCIDHLVHRRSACKTMRLDVVHWACLAFLAIYTL